MNIKDVNSNNVDKTVSKEKKIDIKYYCRIGFTLLVIAAVTASMLAFVNFLTKERIAQNEFAVMQEAIKNIFADSDKIEEVEGEYKEPIVAVYAVYKGDELLGHGIQTAPVGFKDKIGLIVGVDNDRKCVGVEVTSLSDTPGVGTKVKEKTFLERFVGIDSFGVDEVELISGSTVSSTAVKEGIKAALAYGTESDEEEIFGEDNEDFPDDYIPEDYIPEDYIPEDEIPEDYIPEEEFPCDLFDEPVEAPVDTTEIPEQTEGQNGGAA